MEREIASIDADILRIFPDVIARVLRDGSILEVRAPLGFSIEEAVRWEGKRLSDLLSDADTRDCVNHIEACLDHNRVQRWFYKWPMQSGRERSIEVRFVRRTPHEAIAIARDMTLAEE